MVQVSRKDEREANENIIRRFNRKSFAEWCFGASKSYTALFKASKQDRASRKAIIRKERKADKLAKMRLGIR